MASIFFSNQIFTRASQSTKNNTNPGTKTNTVRENTKQQITLSQSTLVISLTVLPDDTDTNTLIQQCQGWDGFFNRGPPKRFELMMKLITQERISLLEAKLNLLLPKRSI